MKYFVTGATGFIGGHVARQLREQNHEVIALVRNPAKAKDLADIGVQLAKGDITDKESMREPMTGVDGVFHIAGWYKVGVRDATPGIRINVEGTRNVLELMKELNIPKGVYTSTLGVYGNTEGKVVLENFKPTNSYLSHYTQTKGDAHYKVADPMMEAGLPLVIVQPGMVYGPNDTSAAHDLMVQYLTGKLPMIPKGAAYCWAHVEDTARAHILAMENGKVGESYNICGDPYTLAEGLAVAEKITGIKAPTRQVSPGILKGVAKVMGVVGAVFPVPENLSAEYIRTSAGVTFLGDNSKAKRELGFTYRPIEEGLRETLEFEMEQLGLTANV